MSLAAVAVLLFGLTGPTGDKAAEPKVTISMVAVEASNEDRELREAWTGSTKQGSVKHYDPALDGATKAALSELPYDTFRKIGAGSAKAQFGQDTRLDINDTYTLCVKPLSRESNGLIRANAWIEERPKGKAESAKDEKAVVRKVLSTTVKAVPGDRLILGGLNLDRGVLVIALTLGG